MTRPANRHLWPLLAVVACLAGADRARCEESKPLPFVKGSTTLAILPDTERYSDDYPQYFEAQTKWIAENHKIRSHVPVSKNAPSAPRTRRHSRPFR